MSKLYLIYNNSSAILLLEQVAFYSVEMALFNCRGQKPPKPGTDEVQFMLSYQKESLLKIQVWHQKGKYVTYELAGTLSGVIVGNILPKQTAC